MAEAVRAESSLPSVNGTSKVGGGAVVAISCADYKHSMFLCLMPSQSILDLYDLSS